MVRTGAKKAQHELVLEYLLSHECGMTSKDGQRLFGIMQMPKRIFILRKDGWNIVSVPCKGKNRFGDKVNFVRYVLRGRA